MKLVQFAIRRKTLFIMLFLAVTLLGYISYQQLPVELLPNTELPFLIVQATARQEMDPKYIEKKAIIPLEGAISSLEGIDSIESFAERRSGRIMVYFNPDVAIKYVHLKLQERINAVKATLGDEFTVMVLKVDTQQLSSMFMRLQVRGSGDVDRIRNVVDRKVLEELENIDGMARVEVFGGREETVEIILNEEACKAYNITSTQIRSAITRNNRNKTFVGQVYEKNRRYFVNLTAEFTDVHQLENIVLKTSGPVLLKDVANVYFGVKERTSISRINGQESVTLQLMRETLVNMIALSHATRAVISDLNNRLQSDGIEIVIQSDSAEEIENNVDLIKELALTGGLLAVLILWIFLRNARMLMVISLTIPVSILMALNLFYAYDISLNSLTLVGIALAVGMLVDNSVVVLENIYRLLAGGRHRDQAVVQGTGEVSKSVIASTLTTCIVFLPFIFTDNFFLKILGRHVGISIIATVLMSLIVAMLLVPLVLHALIRKKTGENRLNFSRISSKNRLVQLYTLLLKSSMRFPGRTVINTAVVFFASLLICLGLSLDVPREVELTEFPVYLTMSRGATMQTTDMAVADLEKLLDNIPEKQELVSEIFEEEATVTVKLRKNYKEVRHFDLSQVKGEIQKRIERFRSAEVSLERPESSQRYGSGGGYGGGGGSMGAGLERLLGIGSQEEKVVIKGTDFELMMSVAAEVRTYLENLSDIRQASLSVSENRPEIHVLLDNLALSQSGLTADIIAAELASFQSEYATNLSYKQGVDEYDIIIHNENLVEKTMADLRELRIPDVNGGLHNLQDVSRIIYSQGMTGINRVNQEKLIDVRYSFQTDVTADKDLLESARSQVDQIVAAMRLPSGMAIEVVHDDLDLSEFYFLLAAAFILIYMVMASVFESLWMPMVMMFTLPLAAIGSLWALIVTGNSILNANALIGFLILLGVVVNNGIIFIDFANILRKRGFRRSRALVMAGRSRVRPILITSLTTVIGMLPLAMGKAEYVTRIGAPFAITMIGGLSLSTIFTLIFIPTVYSGLENALLWFRDLKRSVRWLQIALFIGAAALIYFHVDSNIWKFIDLFVCAAVIPGLIWFIQSSLRRAQAQFIREDESITIRVQHLVKVYDDDMRFIREWKKGKKIADEARPSQTLSRRALLEILLWQIPLWVFLIYFIFFYLETYLWAFLFSHILFFYTIHIWRNVARSPYAIKHDKIARLVTSLYKWLYPGLTLLVFFIKWENPAGTLFLLIIWYALLIIYSVGRKLDRDRINIARVSGRFSGLQRSFYRFVSVIPVIGRRKQPFKALNNVSLEIGSGMFGLLGPNGAGKTTLMRIICGILEQSRGSIWINGISLKEKREELQGLIGYLPQEFGVYENMTAFEFLSYQAILKGLYDKEEREKRIAYVLSAVHLDAHRDQKIGSFSGGMKQRIGIAQTLLHLPRILVVDEPTAGLDPRERIRFRNLLVELSRERVVLFSTHIIEDISSSCSHVAVLNEGRLFYFGEPAKMVDIAAGKIWQVLLTPAEFDAFQQKHRVVHHIRVGEHIRVRCLSETRPHPGAENTRPTLEDAYLTLLRH